MKIDKAYSKGIGKLNEDAFLIEESLFVVADGATSRNKYLDEQGLTGGYLAANILINTYKNDFSNLIDTAILANEKLLKAMTTAGVNIDDDRNLWKASFVAIEIKGEEIEWVRVGDCEIMTVSEDVCTLLGSRQKFDSEALIHWQKLARQNIEDIGKAFANTFKLKKDYVNTKLGVLNGDPRMANLIEQGSIPKDSLDSIILFTDGLSLPTEDPTEDADTDLYLKLYEQGGLAGLMKHVRRLEQSDASLKKYARFKKHDDIAAISIDFN